MAEILRSMHSVFARHVGWRLFGWVRPVIGRGNAQLAQALSWLGLSQAEVEARQLNLLKQLLERAFRDVPYYKELCGELGASTESITQLSDVRRLPLLSKEIVQKHRQSLCTSRREMALIENASGGSSGEPVIVYQTNDSVALGRAVTLAADMIAGYRLGAPLGILWGGHSERTAMRRVRTRFASWLMNTPLYDTFDMDESRMAEYHRGLSRFQPDVIVAYASSLHMFARFLESRGIRPDYPRRGLISSAETLTAAMRGDIDRVFPVRVYNRYGSREVGIMGMECDRHEGLHVMTQNVLLEVVNIETGEPLWDEPGEIVATTLHNHGMPLIRYRTGDSGVMTKRSCPCGWAGPMLTQLLGRVCDIIRMPSGAQVHGEYFTHLLYGIPGVRQFRFVQNDLYDYELLLVTDEQYEGGRDAELGRAIGEMTGAEADVHIRHVERLEPLRSGKHRFVFSRLSDAAAQAAGAPAGPP